MRRTVLGKAGRPGHRRCSASALAACACLSLLLWAPALRADNEALAEARALYHDLRFTEAYEAYRRALAHRGNRPTEIAHIYERLGIIAAAAGSRDEALGYFRRLLCLNPEARLPAELSPKVQEPFDLALAQMKEVKPFRLTQRSARPLSPEGGLVVEVELDPDSLGMAVGATLQYRRAGTDRFFSLAREGTGALVFTVAPSELPAGGRAEYFIEVNDAFGSTLWELGTSRSPLVCDLGAAAPPTVGAAAVPDGAGAPVAERAAGDEAAGAWYQSVWVWVGAGAAAMLVAAGVTTVAVMAATAPAPSSVDFEAFEYEVAQAR